MIDIKEYLKQTRTVLVTQDAFDELVKKVSVQRTGEWIFPYGDRKYKKCSACERVYYSIPHDSNYCPNCGCRMTEGTP